MSSVVFPLVIAPGLTEADQGVPSPFLTQKPLAKPGSLLLSPSLFVAVLAIHIAVLFALFKPATHQKAVTLPRSLSVRLIAATDNIPPPKPQPVEKSTPVAVRPVRKALPVVATTRIQPAQAPDQPVPPPAFEAPAKAVVADASPTIAEPAPPAPPALPAPLVQPSFNADYLDNPKPPYPALSRRQHEEGEVRLRVWVGTSGEASKVELFRSSGFERLDRVALETVQRWRFVPARLGEQAVAAWVVVPIAFNLRSE